MTKVDVINYLAYYFEKTFQNNFFCKAILGFIGFFLSIPYIHIFALLISLDLLTGWIKCLCTGQKITSQGMKIGAIKILMYVLLLFTTRIISYLDAVPFLIYLMSAYICITETISIYENIDITLKKYNINLPIITVCIDKLNKSRDKIKIN